MPKIPTFAGFCKDPKRTVPILEMIEEDILKKIKSDSPSERPTFEQLELGLAACFHTDHYKAFEKIRFYLLLNHGIEISRGRDLHTNRGEIILGNIVEEELSQLYKEIYPKTF